MGSKQLCNGPTLTPDKGYVWFILVMSFFSHFAHIGFSYGVVGVLTVAHKDFFKIDIQESSLIGSLHLGVMLIFGPVASVLVKKFGCRITELAGGVCIILGVGLSSLSTLPWHAFLLFSILTGVGNSICISASTEILAKSFNKYRYLAFSVATTGAFIGSVVWPLTSQYLLNIFGYSKAMGIMASIHTIHIIAGISYFAPSSKPATSSPRETRDNITGEVNMSYQNDSNGGVVESTERNANIYVVNTEEARQVPSEETQTPDAQLPESNLKADFISLLKRYKVWLLIMHAFLWGATVSTVLIVINNYIVTRTGLSPTDVAFGITITGIAAVVGSVGVSLTSTLNYDRLILHFSSVLLLSIITIVLAFADTKEMYYGLAALWGIGQGVTLATLVSVVSDCCGAGQQAVLFGMSLCLQGIGGFAGSQLYVYIGTATESIFSLLTAGIVSAAGNLLLIPLIVSNIRRRRKAEEISG